MEDVQCCDGVSSFDDDVHAVGKVTRVDDERVFEGERLVRGARDSVTGNASFMDC